MARIILIEPDRLLAETYARALVAADHQVVTAAGAQTAITTADRAKPDLVILELQLIGHSGVEFMYEFRSYPEWQDIPVIIHTIVPLSEFADSQDLMKRELGVNTYLYKPRTSLRQLVSAAQDQLTVKA